MDELPIAAAPTNAQPISHFRMIHLHRNAPATANWRRRQPRIMNATKQCIV
jgi:hypothetical protein